MIKFILFTLWSYSFSAFAALDYSKIEHPGCPENSFCSKETGKTRDAWKKTISDIHLTTNAKNAKIKGASGFPVSGWALEEAQILPNIIMWDSPCKNHKNDLGTYYISEFFVKKIDANLLKDYKNLYFPKTYISNSKNTISSQFISREDLPLFTSNKGLHYLKTDDGAFYGLVISSDGEIEISDVKDFTNPAPNSKYQATIDAVCTKEQIDAFKKEAPNSSFYASYYCKNIWNITTKSYDNLLFGRSCD